MDLQVETQIGLVGAVVVHRLMPGEPTHRTRQLHVDELPDLCHHFLGDGDDIVLIDEAHLDVQLSELGLPVGPEVLVAVAAGDLVVALHAGDHQQLLEQLGALRQRVPRARPQPGGHQEVTGALGSGPGQRGGFDVDEAQRVERLPDGVGDRRTQPDGFGLARTTQIQVAVLEPGVLADIDALIDRERQRRGGVEYLEFADHDLDLTGHHGRIDRVLRPGLDHTGDSDAELVAQLVGAELID
ncbi:hypothetical protein SDC9_76482 [bioreactor metagenome]|uniref:Uncharacterized protein n=1 Tax=bioreactor metagenome TaxID=1076179 RepID=A0A644YNC3_9ZZZZ